MPARIRPETAFLRNVSAAATALPSRPLEIKAWSTVQALKAKLEKMAQNDPAKASGMWDLLKELYDQGLIKIDLGGRSLLGNESEVMYGYLMNAIAKELNANAVRVDDKEYIPVPREFREY